jgi:hypothetical protein
MTLKIQGRRREHHLCAIHAAQVLAILDPAVEPPTPLLDGLEALAAIARQAR